MVMTFSTYLGFANPNRLGPWSGIVGTQMSNVGLEDGLINLDIHSKERMLAINMFQIYYQKRVGSLGENLPDILSAETLSAQVTEL